MDELLELALYMKAATRGIDRFMDDALAPLGITVAQADALTVIGQAQPLSLKELGGLLIAEAGHPSRLVERLVAAGLVDRRQEPADRRRLVLSLTRRGHDAARHVAIVRRDALDLAAGLVGPRPLAPSLQLLGDVLSHSPYAALLARRRALEDAHAAAA